MQRLATGTKPEQPDSPLAAESFGMLALSPAGTPDIRIPAAASRAGAIGVLDLTFAPDKQGALDAFAALRAAAGGTVGILLDADDELLDPCLAAPRSPDVVLLSLRGAAGLDIGDTGDTGEAGTDATLQSLTSRIQDIHHAGAAALVVATRVEHALLARAAGANAVIAKGNESGGWVEDEGAFILLQRCLDALDAQLPVWVQGGVGLHTVAACKVAGAAGVVLDAQLLLTRESPLPAAVADAVRRMDGSESIVLGADLGGTLPALGGLLRAYRRPGLAPIDESVALSVTLGRSAENADSASNADSATSATDSATSATSANTADADIEHWRRAVSGRVDWDDPSRSILAIGQDACFAAELAQRYVTVGGILDALHVAIAQAVGELHRGNPLGPRSSLAAEHGTRYPIVQGPMTRVSDCAQFAADVAEGGALPFLALSLLRGHEVEKLLTETRELIGDKSWGVGILGFVPADLRSEQLAAVRRAAPPFALIAGGRPEQARDLEADGIRTYLHVPSPGLLSLFLKDGARRFVFEGRECGGHVGPRTSFVLWERIVATLLAELPRNADPAEYSILFAGGIHDARSAAMVAAVAAPLAARGIHVGVLCGTAYLFTDEAVRSGAITEQFRTAAQECTTTTLLESGPGHATRCIPSPFTEDFRDVRRTLVREGIGSEEIRERLEALNLGRLRIASKGLDRAPADRTDNPDNPDNPGRTDSAHNADSAGNADGNAAGANVPALTARDEADAAELHGTAAARTLVEVPLDQRWHRGMFMIGQVAALRSAATTIAELHADVSAGSSELLSLLPHITERLEPTLPPADVAIIGMAGILPDAPDLRTFWSHILAKHDAVTEVPAHRWDIARYFDAERSARDRIYSRWGGFVDDVPLDPLSLGMPPNTLSSIEPFQLLGLLTARTALQDAGYQDRPFARERTGVVFGAGGGGGDLAVGYTVRSSIPALFGDDAQEIGERLDQQLPEWTEDSFPGLLMNVVSGRIANRLDLGGPNFTVDAACASSLAAISIAVRDLQTGVTDMAIAGGVDAIQNPFAYLCFSKTQALSPTGRCRPFDADADGIAISEGFAAVVLKRLTDAERDGDRIYAVIKGVGAGSDGRDRSLTAPRPEGQMRALRRAYAHAGVSPATVGLVEAHGTGTVAGDRAEITSLGAVFAEAGSGIQHCAVGSVKSMIGHTKAAAGVAGLMKAALALHHRVLPPTLGVRTPNPRADFPNSPFYVNTEPRPWLPARTIGADGTSVAVPRRAGVSAFGFGGTNFHIVMEEYSGSLAPEPLSTLQDWPAEIFVFRGPTADAVSASITGLLDQLRAGAAPRPVDLAAALVAGIGTGPVSVSVVAADLDDLAGKLGAALDLLTGEDTRIHRPDGVHVSKQPLAPDGSIAFLFPGQGSQFVDMGRDVANAFPAARRAYELADRVLEGRLAGRPLSRYIFPPPVFSDEERSALSAAITETDVAQSALGATELAYLAVLDQLGVRPDLTAGHSYGEFVALAAAGSISAVDLLRVSEARGRFIREESAGDLGTMAGLSASPDELADLLTDSDLHLANLNSPKQTVVAGSQAAIDRALAWCRERNISGRQLPVACGFHSPFVEPAQRRLAELLAATPISAPKLPVFSNTTAAAHSETASTIVEVLADHLVRPVQFTRQISAMHAAGAQIFVEVGPKTVLSGLVDAILGEQQHLSIAVDRSGRQGHVQLLDALAALVSEGVPVRLDRLVEGRPVHRLNLRNLAGSLPALSPATWFVNGGRATPMNGPERRSAVAPPPETAARLHVPAQPMQQRISPVQLTEVSVNGHPSANGSAAAVEATAPFELPSPPAPARWNSGDQMAQANAPGGPVAQVPAADSRPAVPLGPVAGPVSGAAEVMYRYQDVMQHFLDSQRAVMLAFLGSPEARTVRPAPIAYRPAPPPYALQAPGVAPVAPPPAQVAPPVQAPATGPVATAPVSPVAAPAPVAAPPPVVQLPPDPPPTAAVPAPTPPPATGHTPPPAGSQQLSEEMITAEVLKVVSGRTGYPEDMLSLDADMEADLGIDSIKRVEIAGLIFEALPVPDGVTPELERLTTSKTLRQVIEAVVATVGSGNPAGSGNTVQADTAETAGARPFDSEPTVTGRVGRLVLGMAAAPAAPSPVRTVAGEVIVVVDGPATLSRAAADRVTRLLLDAGAEVLRVRLVDVRRPQEPPAPRTTEAQLPAVQTVEFDPLDPDTADAVALAVHEHQGPLGGLLYLAALAPGQTTGTGHPELTGLFLLARVLHGALRGDSHRSRPFLAAATRLGGDFGITGQDAAAASAAHAPVGGLHGLIKTLGHEWPDAHVKGVDLGTTDPQVAAELLLAEALADDGLVEVGYPEDGRRLVPTLSAAPIAALPDAAGNPHSGLSRESVILLTGGARGITAEIADELAMHAQPTLVLVGRTPLALDEDGSTAGLTDMADIKRALIERERARGKQPTPARIGAAYQQLLAEREVRATLHRLELTGSRVDYRTCDVRDGEALSALVEEVYDKYGRIDGVVHGAGAIEDKLIQDKSFESFQRVVATKLAPALVLADRLRPESLRFLAFFSSVSARFGNRGQGDYAAANEALNKLACALDRQWSARVVAFNWGPWESAGMVSPEVRRQFAERGVTLIPVATGRRAFLDELWHGRKGEVEVTIGGAAGLEVVPSSTTSDASAGPASSGPDSANAASPAARALPLLASARAGGADAKGAVRFVRRFELATDPFLTDHRIDGVPVVPFAVVMELMAEVAASVRPDLQVTGLREVRLYHGITVDDDNPPVEVVATPFPETAERPPGVLATLDLRVLSLAGPRRGHYKALVDLAKAPAVQEPTQQVPLHPQHTLETAVMYRDHLFHGPLFQGVTELHGIDASGAVSVIRPSAAGACVTGGTGNWLLDPVVVDSALQLQLVWSRLNWDLTLLPLELAELSLRTSPSPATGAVNHQMVIRADSARPLCRADHEFRSADGTLLLAMRGMVGAGSAALNRIVGNHSQAGRQ